MVYFGDNKSPGRALHDTQRRGNLLLRDLFASAHADPSERDRVPPIFVFGKASRGRDVRFLGLAVPGARDVTAVDDLVAVWRTKNGQRFQNYRAILTVLDVPVVTRSWIQHVITGDPLIQAPALWALWRSKGKYSPLTAPQTLHFRTREEQLPGSNADAALLDHLRSLPRHA